MSEELKVEEENLRSQGIPCIVLEDEDYAELYTENEEIFLHWCIEEIVIDADINAPTIEAVIEKFNSDADMIPLPEDGEYVGVSFKLTDDDPRLQKMFADIPDQEEPVQTEAVECCPFCEGESVFPNWDVETQGYIAKCQAYHQAESTSTETTETPEISQKPAAIKGNDVTDILYRRWIACYMLYDWNPKHAEDAYSGNMYDWIQQTYKRLEDNDADADTDTLTDTFNQILLEDVEDFIQTHMSVWKGDRLTVEAQVVKALAELNAMT